MTLAKSQADGFRVRLRAVARAYLGQARAMSYRELRTQQDPPWASVGFGAAGIAAALSHARRAHHAEDLLSADRWLAEAARGSRARGAFSNPALGTSDLRGSLYYGADGVHLVRVLVACARGKARAASLTQFLTRCRRMRGGPTELLQGVAGHLIGLVILYRRTAEPRVLDIADELARDLLGRARGRDGWLRAGPLGFAHGRAGSLYALLAWSLAGGCELPAPFFDDLAELATDVERSGTMGAPSADPTLQRSWCNGAGGLVLLWAKAHEHTPNAAHLRLARHAARFLLTYTARGPGDLCCGFGGRAYALLAMDRIDPERGWYERALAMAARAVAAMLEGSGDWPNGLYKGYPGLVCLTDDLMAAPRNRVGFPLVEG